MREDHADAKAKLTVASVVTRPEMITEHVRLSPTEQWHLGDSRPRSGGRSFLTKFNLWQVSPDIPASRPYEEHVLALLDLVSPSAPAFRDIARRDGLTFGIVLKYYATEPILGVFIGGQELRAIASLGAELDIDQYWFGPDPATDWPARLQDEEGPRDDPGQKS